MKDLPTTIENIFSFCCVGSYCFTCPYILMERDKRKKHF